MGMGAENEFEKEGDANYRPRYCEPKSGHKGSPASTFEGYDMALSAAFQANS
jgi:hypothetical protein